jgi:hypothetical protein
MKEETAEQTWLEIEVASGFRSKLNEGRQRFLAHAMCHALDIGRLSAEDFIRHFPPSAIMEGLKDRPTLRAKILNTATGVKFKIALKKSAASSGEDLLIALDEGEVDPETVIGLFHPDDRVRHLDNQAIWKFVTEDEFWEATGTDMAVLESAKAHVAFMLDRGLHDKLITHQDIVEGITVERFVQLLPRKALGDIIIGALQAGRGGTAFTDVELLAQAPSTVLVEHVPLSHIWTNVIVPKISQAHGYVAPSPVADSTTDRSDTAAEDEVMPDLGDSEATEVKGKPFVKPKPPSASKSLKSFAKAKEGV